jgi:phasin family protein
LTSEGVVHQGRRNRTLNNHGGNIMAKPEMPFMDISKMMEQFKMPGVDMEGLMNARRKDVEALMAANKHAYEGMQAMAQRQAQILQETMTEWQGAAKGLMSSTDPTDVARKQGELAKQAFAKALENMRELADMATKSQNEAFAVISERVHENMESLKKLQPK